MRRRNFTHVYQAKTYELPEEGNPLFPKKPKRVNLRRLALFSLIGAVMVTAIAAFIFGPWFKITGVAVAGTVTIPPQDITDSVKQELEGKRYLIFPNNHRWFYSAEASQAKLHDSFLLDSVDIEKKQGIITVTVVEDVSMLALISGDNVYIINRQGKVIRQANEPETAAIRVRLDPAGSDQKVEGVAFLPNMPIITNPTPTTYEPDQQVFTPEVIESLIQFYEALEGQNIKPRELVSASPEVSWFTVKSDQPYTILFDARRDIDEQSLALKAVRDEYSATPDEIDYIDVRFGSRVYVK